MSGTFDFGKLAFEIINCVTETMVRLHPEISHGEGDMTLFQGDEYYELEESVADILSHAGENQGHWCMWFLRQEDIIEVYNEEYEGGYDLTNEEEKEVVRFMGEAFEIRGEYKKYMLVGVIRRVVEGRS
jgi:hypothetical protein